MIGRWAVSIILFFVILLMLLPGRDEQSLSRIGSASMLACSKEVRKQVAAQLLSGQAIEVSFSNTCPDLIADLSIGAEGGMRISGNKYPVMMTLEPVVENGAVRWRCRGEPTEMVTPLCKP